MNMKNSKSEIHYRDAEKGFTMIELLISLFLTGVIATFVMQAYVNQHKVVLVQDQVADMQQNARAAIDELSRQVRMAGYGVPIGMAAIVSSNTNPDTIMVNYNARNCDGNITDPMPQPSAELKLRGGQDLNCFFDGLWTYIFDPTTGTGEWFTITEVQKAAGHIQHNLHKFTKKYGVGSIVLNLEQIKFYIDNSDTLHPNLMIQVNGLTPEIYAENIEDLQFNYVLKNGNMVDSIDIKSLVREVKISLRARTDSPDPDFPHNPYRLRSYTSSVNPRNLPQG